jgi:hypothetical protein
LLSHTRELLGPSRANLPRATQQDAALFDPKFHLLTQCAVTRTGSQPGFFK